MPPVTAQPIRPLRDDNGGIAWSGVLMIASFAIFVQSYVAVKLAILGWFLVGSITNVALNRVRLVVCTRLVSFYFWISVVGVAWALVGALHAHNYIQGDVDALKLYVVWSAAFVVLYTLLGAGQSLRIFHGAMVLAGILIPLINLAGLYDALAGGGFISESVRLELNMEIGFHAGYIQMNSVNIGTMFLIVPYLLSLQFRADSSASNSPLTKLALAMSLILVVVSGRRALWLVVALTPCTVLLVSVLGRTYGLLKSSGRRFLLVSAVVGVIGLGALAGSPEGTLDLGTIDYLKRGFSSEDERTIQKPYLIAGFKRSPLFGSGFGAYAGYTRSDERPWTYELTYHRALFNMGVVGMTALGVLFLIYISRVFCLLRRFKEKSATPFALFVACLSLFAGAYADPYFGSFDYLFFVGLLPHLSTFERGFGGGTAGSLPTA